MKISDLTIKISKQEYRIPEEEKIRQMGQGEWVDEYDLLQFEYLGYQASIVRKWLREPITNGDVYFGGYLCGYIEIPEYHPFFKTEDNFCDIDCHGAITFNQFEENHYIGFDCAHSGDYIPTLELFRKNNSELQRLKGIFPLPQEYKNMSWFYPVYRNMDYCIQECKLIIKQLGVTAGMNTISDVSNGSDR